MLDHARILIYHIMEVFQPACERGPSWWSAADDDSFVTHFVPSLRVPQYHQDIPGSSGYGTDTCFISQRVGAQRPQRRPAQHPMTSSEVWQVVKAQSLSNARLAMHLPCIYTIIEGCLEVKLPTIGTDGKGVVGRGREKRKLRREKESEERRCRRAKRYCSKVAIHSVFHDLWLRRVEK